jgi:hypothetical protein
MAELTLMQRVLKISNELKVKKNGRTHLANMITSNLKISWMH